MGKIKRSAFASFMDISGTNTPSWARFGKGITSQTISYNPSTTSEQYIDEDSATTTLDNYAPVMDGAMTAYEGDPIFEYVDALRQSRAVGADAETDVLLVYIYDSSTTGTGDNAVTSYRAEKQHVCISIDDFGGEAGGGLPINFTVNFMGDALGGTCTVAAGVPTFTADT